MGTFLFILGVVVILVAIANRIGVAWPIVLVLGGMAIGYIPGAPTFTLPPDLVLVVFLPPLLYWESLTAPTSEFVSGAWWIFQLAVGLVIITTVAVAAVIHAFVPALGWPAAFVLGATVSSTDEVAFSPIVERLKIPRHVVATIEGESLVNDATSLVLYAIAVGAVVSGTFSWSHALVSLVISIAGGIGVGLLVGGLYVAALYLIKDDVLQPVIALMAAFGSYLLASRVGASGVLAVVTTGVLAARYSALLFRPLARIRGIGFLATFSFIANASIFVLVGMQFHPIMESLSRSVSLKALILYGVAVSLTVIVVRLLWTFGQGLLPFTNEPEHTAGKADWSHVAILAWSGMRGGVSLAAALAIPFETASGPFVGRELIIYLTFCVLLATLVGQAGTLPLLIRWLHVTDDGTDAREERLALAKTAKAALLEVKSLRRNGEIPAHMLDLLEKRFRTRWQEFSTTDRQAHEAARHTALYRQLEGDLLDAQRRALVALRDHGKIDNTVLRRIQTLLDLETAELEILGSTGHTDADVGAAAE
jgi:monovalent cation/hydrogen antiporter